MWLDKVAKTRDEKIELLNLFADEFYRFVVKFEPNIADKNESSYFVTFEDSREEKMEDCFVSDFEFDGFSALNETNSNIHWALFVCEKLESAKDKRKYWSEFKKYTLSKDKSLKKELEDCKPNFDDKNELYF